MRDVFVVDAVRSPVGRLGSALAAIRPDDLAGQVIVNLMARSPDLDPADVDDVYVGNANGAGEDGRNVARTAALLGGLPPSVPGTTINRLDGSGVASAIAAAQAIATGDADVCVAGGVESMSRAPWVVAKPAHGYTTDDGQLLSTTSGWRLVNPRFPVQWTSPLGEMVDRAADELAIARPVQDAWALSSHQRARAAWDAGRFDHEVVPVRGARIRVDECVHRDLAAHDLARQPAQRVDGTVTTGNAAPMGDGAAMMLMTSALGLDRCGGTPIARVAARAVVADDPRSVSAAAVRAARTAMERAAIDFGDLTVVEIGDAFAAQSIAMLGALPELNRAIVNPNGGAIAIGHPVGAAGARLLTSMANELRRVGGWGLVVIQSELGEATACILEAVNRENAQN
ncbi:MAG: acetyl-CoA C-acyltransferase [Actinomycetota bacterium]